MRKRRAAPVSEYGRQLQQKQDLKEQYNIREKQLKSYVQETLKKGSKGDTPELFVQKLEQRLDNVVFRAGFAATRKQSRQMVTHGHFLVNGRRADVPSIRIKKGDVIMPRPSSLERTLFKNAVLGLKKYEAPSWLKLDKGKGEITMLELPTLQETALAVEIPLIFEFYSR